MNCKPGDLAVIVNSTSLGGTLNGCMVRCFSLAGDGYWNVEPLSERLARLFKRMGPLPVFDQKLRPLRDPGEDAKDETLSWKPVPVEGVTA